MFLNNLTGKTLLCLFLLMCYNIVNRTTVIVALTSFGRFLRYKMPPLSTLEATKISKDGRYILSFVYLFKKWLGGKTVSGMLAQAFQASQTLD